MSPGVEEKRRTFELSTVPDYVRRRSAQDSLRPPARMICHGRAAPIVFEHVADLESTAPAAASTVSSYAPYLASIGRATVAGGASLVFTADGYALDDTLADADFGDQVRLPRGDFVRAHVPGRAVRVDLSGRARKIERAFVLSGLFARHFGHWIAEYLPRLRLFERHPEMASIPIVVESDMPPSHFELLRDFCDNELIVLGPGEIVCADELLVAPTITFYPSHLEPGHSVPPARQAAWSAEGLGYVRDRILRRHSAPIERTRAIYLSRSASSWGTVAGEADVETSLSRMGFEIVRMQEHSFAEQVELIRSSHTIVGPTGSALNLLVLADPSTDLLVLSQAEPHNWGGWAGPMRELGFDPKFMLSGTGSSAEKHARIVVDIDRMERVVRELLDERRRP